MAKLSNRLAELSAVKLSYLASQLRSRREIVAAEPIAVTGMSCRFPEGGEHPETFWRFLEEARPARREIPRDRWDNEAYYDPTPGVPGKIYTRYAAFVEGVDRFDAAFFGISPRDAREIDPQQRFLLEDCWHALEHAGVAPGSLVGSRTGVFVGLMHYDYNIIGLMGDTELHSASLNYASMASGRLAHVLGFQGPVLGLDTACSSSLTTVHLACQALRNDECDLALAGGVSLCFAPLTMMYLCQNRMLAPDGLCKTFDAAADGYGRGEGSGVVVLKRLSDALAAGDRIAAVIRGSGLNHDGRSSAIMVPNGRAQERLIRATLEGAGVDRHQVGYLEAHGTGTALGDPIEMEAIGAVFARDPARDAPLLVGSVKTNIGHLEAAAGVAALIKVILSLQHEAIPAHLNFERPNPSIRWAEIPVEIPTSLRPWPRGERRRIACVSGFGYSGINAHLVVEEAPLLARTQVDRDRPAHVLTISARTDEALDDLVAAHRRALEQGDLDAGDACYTLSVCRTHFDHRAAVTGATTRELAAALAHLRDEPRPPREPRRGAERPRPVFLFTGQGSQYPGMGRELYETQPAFRAAFARCSDAIEDLLQARLEDIVFADADRSRVDDARYLQPSLFAFEVALAALWASWGVVPAAVIGHSLGELSAACVAGVFSLEDGARLVAERARILELPPGEGAMMSLETTPERAAELIAPHAEILSVAAVNGPRDVVVSGKRSAIEALASQLASQGIEHRRLRISNAYHSPLMDPMLDAFEAAATRVRYAPPRVPFVSNVEGGLVHDEITRPGYWRRHVRERVRFAEGLLALRALGHRVHLEIGPTPVLSGLARRALVDADELCWLASLRPRQGETAVMLAAAAELYTRGFDLDWPAFDAPFGRRAAGMPGYAFQRERCWLDVGAADSKPSWSRQRSEGHPLIGRAIPLAGTTERRFSAQLGRESLALLTEHNVIGRTILPGSCYVEMALAIAREAGLGERGLAIVGLAFERPLVFPEAEQREVQVVLSSRDGRSTVEVYARETSGDGSSWRRLAAGEVEEIDEARGRVDLESLFARMPRTGSPESFYALMARNGVVYGPSFRGIVEIRYGEGERVVRLALSDAQVIELDTYHLHPLLLDGCFQTAAGLTDVDELPEQADTGEAWVPVGFDRLRWLKRAPSSVWVHARRPSASSIVAGQFSADFDVLDRSGEIVAQVQGLRFARMTRIALQSALSASSPDWYFELAWRERPAPALPSGAAIEPSRWILFADDGGFAKQLEALLAQRGDACVTITKGSSYERLGPDHHRIDPEAPEDLARLFAEIPRDGALPVRLVYLFGLDADSGPERASTELAAAVRRSTVGLLHLVQAAARSAWRRPPSLWVVTRGAVAAVEADTVEGVAQAPLWGLGRVVALEHPELACRSVDVDSGERAPARLAGLMSAQSAENLMALRGERLFCARLVQAADRAPLRAAPAIRADGVYLIAGGLGALGLSTAAWLVDSGARHVVLLGRGDASEPAREQIGALCARGAQVTTVHADIASEDDVRRVLASIAARGLALRGIIHSAGTLDDGVILQQTRERMARALASKVEGAWNLHRLTSTAPLDFFVLYASVSSLLAMPGQSSYVAANSFLDALAHHRRQRGLPAMSIDWGRWTGAGMGSRVASKPGAAASAPGMSHERAVQILDELLRRDPVQIGVIPTSAATASPVSSSAHGPLVAELRDTSQQSAARGRLTELLEELRAGDYAQRRTLVSRYAQSRLGALLRFASGAAAPPMDVSLNELGLDSLTAIELKNRVGRELGVELSMSRLIDGSTLDQFVEAILTQLDLSQLLARAPTAGTDVEELSL